MILLAAAVAVLTATAAPAWSAGNVGVPIRMTLSTFACRDMSDMIRMALRSAEGDKSGALAIFMDKQRTGACVPLRTGTIGLLQDAHDEQGLHFDCIKQADDPPCFWSFGAEFGPAP